MSNCNCIRTVKSTAITDLGTFLVITIPYTNFRVRENFKLVICQDIPAGTPGVDPQVVIFDGVNIFLTFNKLSEFVRRSNIIYGTCFHAVASNDPLHIQLRGLVDTCRCPNELLLPAVGAGAVTLTVETILAAITDLVTPPTIAGGAV